MTQSREERSARLRILHVWAEPEVASDTAMDVQIGHLQLVLERFADVLRYESQPACSREDLLVRLNSFRPHVLQISAHGGPDGSIALMHPDSGGASRLGKSELADFLAGRPELRLLVLDCCHGLAAMEALVGSVPAVIGPRGRIREPYPIVFSSALYHSIASGRSLEAAVRDAVVAAAERGDGEATFELWTPAPEGRSLVLCPPTAPSISAGVSRARWRVGLAVGAATLAAAVGLGVTAARHVTSSVAASRPAPIPAAALNPAIDTATAVRSRAAAPAAARGTTSMQPGDDRPPSRESLEPNAPAAATGQPLIARSNAATPSSSVPGSAPPPNALEEILLHGQPPDPGVRYAPPQLELEVVAKRAAASDWQIVRDGEPLSAEARYCIVVRTYDPGYLYVFQVDSAGTVEWLFPRNSSSPYSSGSNPVQPQVAMEIPDRRALYLDDVTGTEHVIAVFSIARWNALEAALAAQDSHVASPEEASPAGMEQSGLRGVGGALPRLDANEHPTPVRIEQDLIVLDPARAFRSSASFVKARRSFLHVAATASATRP